MPGELAWSREMEPVDYIMFRSEVDPKEPPDLEALSDAPPEVRDAAEAAGWLDAGAPTPELHELLRIRPVEREAALRRSLRAPPSPESSALCGESHRASYYKFATFSTAASSTEFDDLADRGVQTL